MTAGPIGDSAGSWPCTSEQRIQTTYEEDALASERLYGTMNYLTFQSRVRSVRNRDPRTCKTDFWWARWRWLEDPMDEGDSQWDVQAEHAWFVPKKDEKCWVTGAEIISGQTHLYCLRVGLVKQIQQSAAEVVRVDVGIAQLICDGVQEQVTSFVVQVDG